MSDNLTLFDNHLELGSQLDSMDNIPFAELSNKWPQLLADLVDVIDVELCRQQHNAPKLTASKLAASIAHYLGGRAIYLPTGDALKIALRDYEIYANWNGNIDTLITKYGLTQSHIYSIINQQRVLHRKRYQIDLFPEKA